MLGLLPMGNIAAMSRVSPRAIASGSPPEAIPRPCCFPASSCLSLAFGNSRAQAFHVTYNP